MRAFVRACTSVCVCVYRSKCAQVSETVGSIFMSLADLTTDGLACASLLRGDVEAPHEGYKVAYLTFLSLAVTTTALSLSYQLRNGLLLRSQLLELDEPTRTTSAGLRRHLTGPAGSNRPRELSPYETLLRHVQQNEWELVQTHRTKVMLSLALLNVAAQGVLHRLLRELMHMPNVLAR